MGLTDEDKSLLREALHKGYVGGTSGALAMTIQVGKIYGIHITSHTGVFAPQIISHTVVEKTNRANPIFRYKMAIFLEGVGSNKSGATALNCLNPNRA